jgi:oligoribonuclease
MAERAGRLVWIDIETSGADPAAPTIREIATLVTDDQLSIVGRGPQLVIEDAVTLADAERLTLAFLREHVDERSAPLCGDTVWKDKQLLERWLPAVVAHLHYRLVDVATIRELADRWYDEPAPEPAAADAGGPWRSVERSIAELAAYRRKLFVSG